MNEKTRRPHLTTIALGLALAGCGGGDGDGDGDGDDPHGPAPTPTGVSLGPAKATIVGPSGGTLVSDDGRLTITIPAGALDEDTTVAIEPVTDATRDGTGVAYRLTPHGASFAVPVTLAFAYSSDDLEGTSAENLRLAFQRSDGYWQVVDDPVVDTESATVAVATRHFSDWVHVPTFVLTPTRAVVAVGGTVPLRVLDCVEPLADDAAIEAIVPGCRPIDVVDYLFEGGDAWCVNGQPLGGANTGTLAPSIDGTESVFTAPATKPDPNTVAVSVSFSSPSSSAQTTLVSNVTIEDDAATPDYTGTVSLERTDLSATAELVWKRFEDLPDVSSYLASGTVHGTMHIGDCDATFSFAVGSGTADDPRSSLIVFNELASAPYTSSHSFHLEPASDAVALDCNGTPAELPASLFDFQVGSTCPFGDTTRVYHSDIDHLTGTWSCAGTDLTASWDFVAPDAGFGP